MTAITITKIMLEYLSVKMVKKEMTKMAFCRVTKKMILRKMAVCLTNWMRTRIIIALVIDIYNLIYYPVGMILSHPAAL